jgi:hypothetical protein
MHMDGPVRMILPPHILAGILALLPIPVLAPITVMLFWLWRLRRKQAMHSRIASRFETFNINPKGQAS